MWRPVTWTGQSKPGSMVAASADYHPVAQRDEFENQASQLVDGSTNFASPPISIIGQLVVGSAKFISVHLRCHASLQRIRLRFSGEDCAYRTGSNASSRSSD